MHYKYSRIIQEINFKNGETHLGGPKPSLKIRTASAIFWIYLGIFRDYRLKNIFFRNKTFLFFKIESWNFQHLFENKFRGTSHNFNSIRQPIEKMKITIVWMSWMSWNIVRFHEKTFSNRCWKFQHSILKNK